MRGQIFRPLAASPYFREALEAKAWAMRYHRKYPETTRPGIEHLTWQLVEQADVAVRKASAGAAAAPY
jgi:hypothetical protein